jgi:hypothetical protein
MRVFFNHLSECLINKRKRAAHNVYESRNTGLRILMKLHKAVFFKNEHGNYIEIDVFDIDH